jgi:hypothetical protein
MNLGQNRIFQAPRMRKPNKWGDTCNRAENGETLPVDKTGSRQALLFEGSCNCQKKQAFLGHFEFQSFKQTGFGKEELKLFDAGGKAGLRCPLLYPLRRGFGENQQHKVAANLQPGPRKAVSFTAQPPRPVPLHRVPKTPGKAKADPVKTKPVFQQKKLRTTAPIALPLAEHSPNFTPSL